MQIIRHSYRHFLANLIDKTLDLKSVFVNIWTLFRQTRQHNTIQKVK